MVFLITGGAGFIGSNLIDFLLKDKNNIVISIDNYDSFYTRKIKIDNQKKHFSSKNFIFYEKDIRQINELKIKRKIDCIIHMAAKAGVRPSIENAKDYFDVNVNGTLQVLEFAKNNNIKQFVFASSSSVYGINPNVPWKESELDLQPISPYASSKIACERIGFTYSYLYDIRFIVLRFFTVYGPRQRPDLAISKFIFNVSNNLPIEVYGDGTTKRDYTYIDDIVKGIDLASRYRKSKFEIFNLGNNATIELKDVIKSIGKICQTTPILNFRPEQSGDVPQTNACIVKSKQLLGFIPNTNLECGLEEQYRWQKKFNSLS